MYGVMSWYMLHVTLGYTHLWHGITSHRLDVTRLRTGYVACVVHV